MSGRLHLYTGTGKGKTTAAMGLAVRALGHGRHVLIAQFLKDGRSGELTALKALGAVVCEGAPIGGFTFRMTPAQREEAASAQTREARALTDRILRERPELIVLDELAEAVSLEMVEREAAEALIRAALACGETVVTGREAPEWLANRADYVSEISAKRHPFTTEGLPAREGIEW